MSKYSKIIFLDEENTALGPLAQEMLKKKLNLANVIGVRVLSRGNVVLFAEPVNQKIGEILKNYGAAKVSELHVSKYEAFLTELSAL